MEYDVKKFESSYEQVKKLVENFSINEKQLVASDYSEARVRADFIDKFFNALGWDVYHNEQINPYEQEVRIEKSVNVEGRQQKRADYAFYIAPNFKDYDVKFYAEAKKPARNLYNSIDYFQTCRYGWNVGTPLAILTDFQELHVLDCRARPDISTILENKNQQYHYKDYLDKEKFGNIYWLFSREAVANNSIEKRAEELPKPRGKAIQKGLFKGGYQSIDEVFLEELDEIRDTLAKAFKKSNPHLGSEELTEMTQRTIDRLVFIRFLEDKQIEPDHYVSEFGDSKAAWKDFIYASRKLDTKYNGIVFKKSSIDSKNFIEPNDREFSTICEELAHVNSPYNFDIIPINILGSIYERFLGKVVIATEKRVRIEEKEEVRKAGGVYYTPQYIVNYIIENTVGKLIEGKTPKEIAKLRFADIACGSGSFLITVFDNLLDYHKKWFQNNPKEAKSAGCYEVDGKWVLSLRQKQKILTNNIFGVDIDPQAVEVTQLSLFLKLLEDETNATAEETWVMFKEQILPSMSDNIICGNSLVGTDVNDGNLFEHEKQWKLKPIDFKDVFPEIMKKGGFDAIVGNPPWSAKMPNEWAEYLGEKFGINSKNINLFTPFLIYSLTLIRQKGIVSLLIPKVFIKNSSYQKIRKNIIYNYGINKITDFGKFPQVASDCVAINIGKFNNDECEVEIYKEKKLIEKKTVKIQLFKTNPVYAYSLDINQCKYELIEKIKKQSKGINEIAEVKRGIELGQKAKLIQCEVCKSYNETGEKYYNTNENKICKKCKSVIKTKNFISISSPNFNDSYKLKCISGKELNRYQILNYYYIPKTLEGIDYKEDIFEHDRVFIKRIATKPEGTFIKGNEKILAFNTVYSIYNSIIDLKYLLGVLQSKITAFYYENVFNLGMNLTSQITIEYLKKVPIKCDLGLDDVMIKDKIVENVSSILEAKRLISDIKTDSEKEYLEKKLKGLERQIDQLVYELYGLTEEEIKIVEGENAEERK